MIGDNDDGSKGSGLTLTRTPGKSVIIKLAGVDVTIRVEVVAVRGQQVRLRFAAPSRAQIWREEIAPDGV